MITLVDMSKDDFQDYLEWSVSNYATEQVKAGTWSEEKAKELAKKQFDQLLPDGIKTKDRYLYVVVDSETDDKVGYLWIGVHPKVREQLFIYDIVIFEDYRGQGYGTATLKGVEEKARELEINKITLHVFGHNEIAISLYKKMNYHMTNIHMAKELD